MAVDHIDIKYFSVAKLEKRELMLKGSDQMYKPGGIYIPAALLAAVCLIACHSVAAGTVCGGTPLASISNRDNFSAGGL